MFELFNNTREDAEYRELWGMDGSHIQTWRFIISWSMCFLAFGVESCCACCVLFVTEYVLMRLCAARAWKVCDSASSFEVFEPSTVHSSVELLLARCT